MTLDELKRAALQYTKRFSKDETFTSGQVIESVVIYFEGTLGTKVKIVLDRNTGEFLTGIGSPARKSN